MLLTYLDFVQERHRIWERRQAGEPGPWTKDPILASQKFTNVFRVLDPGSQFAVELVDAPTAHDALARAFLYRYTNRPQLWRRTHAALGRYPLAADLPDLADLWAGWRDAGEQVFSGAYIIMPAPGVKGVDKTREVVALTRHLLDSGESDNFVAAPDEAARYGHLRTLRAVGAFMAMQVLTDYNYSPFGRNAEDEFVVCGPGAVRGARAIAPRWPVDRTLRTCYRAIQDLPDTPMVAGRVPSCMDVQNTLCEFSKYVRFMGRPAKATPYRPAHPGVQPAPRLPAHWL